jgi:hypothetical protein
MDSNRALGFMERSRMTLYPDIYYRSVQRLSIAWVPLQPLQAADHPFACRRKILKERDSCTGGDSRELIVQRREEKYVPSLRIHGLCAVT